MGRITYFSTTTQSVRPGFVPRVNWQCFDFFLARVVSHAAQRRPQWLLRLTQTWPEIFLSSIIHPSLRQWLHPQGSGPSRDIFVFGFVLKMKNVRGFCDGMLDFISPKDRFTADFQTLSKRKWCFRVENCPYKYMLDTQWTTNALVVKL